MDTRGQELAETFVTMLNTHDPDMVDQFVTEDYITTRSSPTDAKRTVSSGTGSSWAFPTPAPA
jgi:hypothetical protein